MVKKIYIVHKYERINGALVKTIEKVFSTRAKASKYMKKNPSPMKIISEYQVN